MYRSISLLSDIDKILERVIFQKKKEKKKELIYPFQSGFRQKHSTAHALIYLTKKIENN